MQEILPIESIQERDIDLLLLEELSTNFEFCSWFASELNLPQFSEIRGAWRSFSNFGLGETDILFSYISDAKQIFVLVENKLDAIFQPDQYLRYQGRAEKFVEAKDCDEAYCVLVAPKFYCSNQKYFNLSITYEQIKQKLISYGDSRSMFKSALFEIAIEKLRRGYRPINSEQVQKFWFQYWLYITATLPHLKMKEPGIVPAGSDWPMIYVDEIPQVYFYHKLRQGNIDLTFRSCSDDLEKKIRVNLPKDFVLIKHNKTFSVRKTTKAIDRNKPFENQLSDVNIALKNLEELRSWISINKNWL